MRKLAIIVFTIPLTSAASVQAEDPQRKSLGELVCSLGGERATSGLSVGPGLEVGGVAQKLHCIFSNRQTGTSDEYTGTAQFIKTSAKFKPQATLLWDVSVLPTTAVKPGILGQSFTLEADAAQKNYVKVAGQEQSGVKLALQKSLRDAAIAQSLLGIKLELTLSSA